MKIDKNNLNKLKKNKMFKRLPMGWIIAIIVFYLAISALNLSVAGVPREVSYSDFYHILRNNPENIKSLTKTEALLQGEFSDNSRFYVHIPDNDQELLGLMRENGKDFQVRPPRTFLANLFYALGPVILLIFFWWLMASRGEQLGNRILSFGKVRPKIHSEKGQNRPHPDPELLLRKPGSLRHGFKILSKDTYLKKPYYP